MDTSKLIKIVEKMAPQDLNSLKKTFSTTKDSSSKVNPATMLKIMQVNISLIEEKSRKRFHKTLPESEWLEYFEAVKCATDAHIEMKEPEKAINLIRGCIAFMLQWDVAVCNFRSLQLYTMHLEMVLDYGKKEFAKKIMTEIREMCDELLNHREDCWVPIESIKIRLYRAYFLYFNHKAIADAPSAMNNGILYLNYSLQKESLSQWIQMLLQVLPTCFTTRSYRQSYYLIRLGEARYEAAVKFAVNPSRLDGIQSLVGIAYAMHAVSLLTFITDCRKKGSKQAVNNKLKLIETEITVPPAEPFLETYTEDKEKLRKIHNFLRVKILAIDINKVPIEDYAVLSLHMLNDSAKQLLGD